MTTHSKQRRRLGVAGALAAVAGSIALSAAAAPLKPTVVLVHGAFADSSSWDGPVILVGHSYGGTVITQAAVGASHVVMVSHPHDVAALIEAAAAASAP
jgi:alpha-beta hydrolase superfamily lysophospholipase